MEKRYAQRAKKIKGSAIREILKMTAVPGMISFAGGLPSPDTFPYKAMEECSAKALSENGVAMMQYGQTEGYVPLRKRLAEKNGVEIDNLLITTGAQQGIDLACKAFLDPGDVILVENPTFLGALNTFRMYDANIQPVNTDENGIVIEHLEQQIEKYNPKVLYVIPTFQNPTGVTTSLEVRQKISELASKHNIMVIEDDPYKELRFEGKDIPSIFSLNKTGNVIFLTTFSKTVAPGLRVAYALGEEDVIWKMTVGKQSTDVHNVMLAQGMIDEYLATGQYEKHVQDICEIYRKRRDLMIEQIEKHFPAGVEYTKPQGGLFIWCTLPKKIDMDKLFKQALEEKVAFVSGTSFYYDQPTNDNHMRLNFSNSSEENIKVGIERLGQVIKNNL